MRQTRNVVTVLVGIAVAWWITSEVFQVIALLSDVLAIFGFAWLLNLLLEPLVGWLGKRLPRAYSWVFGYLSVLLVLTAFAAPLAAQAAALPDSLPTAIESATHQADLFLTWMRDRRVPVPTSVTRSLDGGLLAQQIGASLFNSSMSLTVALLSVGGQFLLVICVAAAMSAGDDALRNLLLAVMPASFMSSVAWVYDDMRRTYSAAIRGQLSIWGIGMALSFGIMAAFGTPEILLWVGPIALVRLLPYLGGALGGALTMIILLLTLPWPDALLPVLLIFVGQNVIGYIAEPRVLGRALQLSPALVLFVVLAGWKIGGITGIVFGVPAVAVLQTLIEHRVRSRNITTDPATSLQSNVPAPNDISLAGSPPASRPVQ